MDKKSDQNIAKAIKQTFQDPLVEIETRKLAIEEQKLAHERQQHVDNLSLEKEKVRLEKLKIWSSPVFTVILAVITLSATAYVAYWSRKEVEASRIEIYTNTSNTKFPKPDCRACWEKY